MAGTNSQKKINNYPLIKQIGKGGMGEVYVAKHPTLNREIILKKLSIRDKEARERFVEEAKIMLEFRHENIVQIYDHFKDGNSTYIAMEYVKGKPLNVVIQENEMLPIPLALFILYQTALGLHHAHTKKVIHRDIKPHNILISTSGNVKLTDFGIAKKPEQPERDITSPGTIVGTPAYMSPEQFDCNKELTYQSDIYSLGVVFYEMITGVRPYKNEFTPEVVANIAKGKHAPVSKYVKKLPVIARRILVKTFNPNRRKRFKSLVPLIKMLRSFFKKFNIFEVRDSIKRLLLCDKKITESPFFVSIKKLQKRRIIVWSTLLSVLLISLFTFIFIKTNRHYEWFGRKSYGKIILEFDRAELDPNNVFVIIDNKYIKAKFKIDYLKYLNDIIFGKDSGKKIKKIDKKNAKSKKDKKKIIDDIKIEDYIIDKYSQEFYLKEGEHNISVLSSSYRNTKKVVVVPRDVQNRSKKTSEGQLVFVPVVKLWAQEVTVYFRFWDAFNQKKLLFLFNHHSDKNISGYKKESDDLYISYGGKYIRLKDYILMKKKHKSNPFQSNNKYKFLVKKFSAGNIDYVDKIFIADFSVYDRTVVIHTPLTPEPCKVVIKTNLKKLPPIFINNEKQGLVFKDGEYIYQKYNDIEFKKIKEDLYIQEILLPPSSFNIRISKKGKLIKKLLYSGKELILNIKKENGKYKY